MKKFFFEYKNSCLVNHESLFENFNRVLKVEIEKIRKSLSSGYRSIYAPLYLPEDKELVLQVENLAVELKQCNPKLIMVIGIGGSNLGTLALVQALYGSYFNEISQDLKFYCADTIDTVQIKKLLILTERELQNNNNIIIIIVTKSGTTIETLVNGAFFINLIKKYKPQEYKKYIVTVTDRDSPLYSIAQQAGYYVLEIPKLIGGRYSVLSAVGLLPFALLNVNVRALLEGALAMRELCLSQNFNENNAAISALIIYSHYIDGKNIHDIFLFAPDLLTVGNWYRQLVAESLGKSHDIFGNPREVGITPTVSLGTTDLHSVAQLYLGGPRDKLTTFVWPIEQNNNLFVPEISILDPVPIIKNKSIESIKQAIFQGVHAAYIQAERPFMTIILDAQDAYCLGKFFMMKMCEIIYLGSLLKVNAFDQPAVELYKENTRKILAHES